MSYADGLKTPKHNTQTTRMGSSVGHGPGIKAFTSSRPPTNVKVTKKRRASA